MMMMMMMSIVCDAKLARCPMISSDTDQNVSPIQRDRLGLQSNTIMMDQLTTLW